MKRHWKAITVTVFLLVLFTVALVDYNRNTAKADNDFSLELNEECENLPESFYLNQREANTIMSRFFAYLNETYGTTVDDSVYTVNGILAENFPAYYAGAYINTEGRLVVQITDTYYSYDYRNSLWYQEFVQIVESENFYCHPVRYSYSELIDAISEVSLGCLSEEFSVIGIDFVDAGIDDYQNVVQITFNCQHDYDVAIGSLDAEIYEVSVVEGDAQFTAGVYPGRGISTSSTGGFDFSVACRVRRNYPDGTHDEGFLTCGHAFSGNSNVYLYTGANTNTLIGASYSSNQKLGGKADVAYVTANSNATLYNTVYGYTITLIPSYPGAIGTVVYKYGAASQETHGNVMDSSHSTTIQGIAFNDIVKAQYYSTNGDSGGIVIETPNAMNYAYIDGIQSANYVQAGVVQWSYFTKITNDLAALQSGPIYFSLY